MEALYSIPFSVLEVPNLKIKKPTWIHQPSAMTVFSLVLLSYFMVTGGLSKFCIHFENTLTIFPFVSPGIIYDVIVEPPSIGSTTDERGHSRPVSLFGKIQNILVFISLFSFCARLLSCLTGSTVSTFWKDWPLASCSL